MSNITIFRKDYQPPAFEIENVFLSIDLFDDYVFVKNTMQVKRQGDGPLCLFGDELELHSVSLDCKVLDETTYRITNGNIYIDNCPEQFQLEIQNKIRPQENTKLSGLYWANNLFCTQCEAEGFRRITYFPDRPDVLTLFTTRISADKHKYPVLLSNGNLIESGEAENGRHWVNWQDPFKKPAYLFALVAGDLVHIHDEFITCSGRKVDLKIYVEPGDQDKCQYAMESVKRAMRWDEEAFGREYDLDIFMIVAVKDFNMGAMENKGLNIFNSKYILARPDTATDQDYIDIEGVVGHEYFHNWSGNRVTCRDWFQLSLKEGLTVFRDQEFSRDMNARDVFRIADVRILRDAQFPEDAGTMAHPVRPESYQEINNFYTSTVYNKGSEVIRMQQTILGRDGFRKGMDLYFNRHDGQAVTIDDFVAAMEDANKVDFTQFKRWYSQAGTPEVTVACQYHQNRLTINLKQYCRPTPETLHKEPYHIPIRMALYDREGKELPVVTPILQLKKEEEIFVFDNLENQPVVSLLRDFSAPIILHFEQSQEDLLHLLRVESDGYAKWDAAKRLSLNTLTNLYKQEESSWDMPEPLLQAYKTILEDEQLNKDLRGELLLPPSYEDLASCLKEVDVTKAEQVRDYFRSRIGKHLSISAQKCYEKLWQNEDHAINGAAYGRRKLRNRCLWLLMKSQESAALSLCQNQFNVSKTMTDQLASLSLLANSKQEDVRHEALDRFYQQWKDEDLVMDKWFIVQATSELPDALKNVRKLLEHAQFTFKNPNKVRSLIGVFCQANPRNFHANDGSGYQFLTEMILKVDQLNPQIAARLATPFTRWQQLNTPRQVIMKEQLRDLAKKELSRDVREIVSKSLVE
jgi:aminopeptidase N